VRLTANKILHDLQLVFDPGFESARVMENITAMICEDELIVDIVLTTLAKAGPSRSAVIKISILNLYGSIELKNLDRR
jgi:hypothetical protein